MLCGQQSLLYAPWCIRAADCLFRQFFCNRREVYFEKAESVGRSGGTKEFSVFCFQYLPQIFGSQFSGACISERACDISYHMIKESFSGNENVKEVMLFDDPYVMDSTDRAGRNGIIPAE